MTAYETVHQRMRKPSAGLLKIRHEPESLRADEGVGTFSPLRLIRAMANLLPQPGREAEPLQSAPSKDWMRSVLPKDAFELLLDRERSLADRGTRLFTLIVLRRTQGPRRALTTLAQQLRARLRTTDVVGRLGDDRVGILLSDTDPVGAEFLTVLVDSALAELGLELAATMFVYPSVQEAVERSQRDAHHKANASQGAGGTGGSNGNNGHTGSNGSSTSSRSNGSSGSGPHGPGASNGSQGSNGPAGRPGVDGHANGNGNGRAHAAGPAPRFSADQAESRWAVQDLWDQLSLPMPLWKRTIDVVVASVVLVLLLPLFAVIAVAIYIDSPGPVIFRQMRAGRGGRPFAFYKFRSMFVNAEALRAELEAQNEQSGPVFKMQDDPRMTRVGRLLRRWSFDELPQLYNVLKGDISLVGPRSPTLNELPGYERWQRRRLTVTGGLTCTWQVSGRSQIPFPEWMRMDMQYIERRSLAYDIWLLAKTVPAVLTGRGAH